MRAELANIVHPVFMNALRLKDRLERGEQLDFYNEQMELKGRLLSDNEAKRMTEYGGNVGDSAFTSIRGGSRGRGMDQFLGIRYALACWVDEIFIADSRWDAQWNEHKLEEQLYGTNERAWTFWEQAKLAESRPGIDALEVFYLCVMLGFRGDLRDEPSKLKAWADATGKRIGREQGKDFPAPPGIDPQTYVPPLRGRDRLQRMAMIGAVFVLLLIPAMAFFIVRQLLGQ
jgi:type VI secretion system protein ImpK